MEKLTFKQLDEELYYEQLANGLDVYILPKKALIKPMPHLRRNMVRLITILSR